MNLIDTHTHTLSLSLSLFFFFSLSTPCRKRRSAKGVRSLFFIFGTLSVTFWSLFGHFFWRSCHFFSSLFCQTPFAGLLLRQGDLSLSLSLSLPSLNRPCFSQSLRLRDACLVSLCLSCLSQSLSCLSQCLALSFFSSLFCSLYVR